MERVPGLRVAKDIRDFCFTRRLLYRGARIGLELEAAFSCFAPWSWNNLQIPLQEKPAEPTTGKTCRTHYRNNLQNTVKEQPPQPTTGLPCRTHYNLHNPLQLHDFVSLGEFKALKSSDSLAGFGFLDDIYPSYIWVNTPTCVMSLEGSRMTILKQLGIANHTQTWW